MVLQYPELIVINIFEPLFVEEFLSYVIWDTVKHDLHLFNPKEFPKERLPKRFLLFFLFFDVLRADFNDITHAECLGYL